MEKFKRGMKVFYIGICSLVLCACGIKTDYEMNIKNNKSMDFSYLVAIDDEMMDALVSFSNLGDDVSDEQKWELLEDNYKEQTNENSLEEQGYEVERYREDNYWGFKYTKKFKNINEITGEKVTFSLDADEEVEDPILFVKSDKGVYSTKLKLKATEEVEGQDIDFEGKFVVTLPSKPKSHNADGVSKDGKTLTWNLVTDKDKTIEFAFSFHHYLLYIIIAVVIVVIGMIAWYIAKLRKGPQPKAEVKTLFDNMNGANVDNTAKKEVKTEVLDMGNLAPKSSIVNPGEVNDNNVEVFTVSEPEPVKQDNKSDLAIAFPNDNTVEHPQVMTSEPQDDGPVNEETPEVTGKFFTQSEIQPKKVVEPKITVESMFPSEKAAANKEDNFKTAENTSDTDNEYQNKFFG